MRIHFPLLITIAATGTVVIAHQGVTNPAVMKRMQAMTSSKNAANTLIDMAAGKTPFDASTAATAKTALFEAGARTEALFSDQQNDPKSEALPLIWVQWGDFTSKSISSLESVTALDVTDLTALRATLPAMGIACLACHQTYRRTNPE